MSLSIFVLLDIENYIGTDGSFWVIFPFHAGFNVAEGHIHELHGSLMHDSDPTEQRTRKHFERKERANSQKPKSQKMAKDSQKPQKVANKSKGNL